MYVSLQHIISEKEQSNVVVVVSWSLAALLLQDQKPVIYGTRNSALYQKILKENVRPSVCDLKLKRTWVVR